MSNFGKDMCKLVGFSHRKIAVHQLCTVMYTCTARVAHLCTVAQLELHTYVQLVAQLIAQLVAQLTVAQLIAQLCTAKKLTIDALPLNN